MNPETSVSNPESSSASQTAARIGAPVAFALAALTAVGFTIGVLTPPHSGPWCTGDCISYPYADAARFFPRDYWWMIPGILLPPLFMVMAVCVHFCAPERTRPLSLLGVCFATIAAALVSVAYFMQLVIVQPGLERHEFEAMFTMYNPHGLFTALEQMGHLMLAASFFFVSRAVPRESLAAVIGCWSMSTAALIAFVAFVGMAIGYGPEMGTPFEAAIITVDWIALVVAGIALGLWFKGAPRKHRA
ncbi:MAG TPA: hypothetical protein VKB38_12275 [Terracidiphilus sp.]|nr:hypothetical protein [Terracidiphilus sp.]